MALDMAHDDPDYPWPEPGSQPVVVQSPDPEASRPLTPKERRILGVISANQARCGRMSSRVIATVCGMDRRAVQVVLHELRRQNLVAYSGGWYRLAPPPTTS